MLSKHWEWNDQQNFEYHYSQDKFWDTKTTKMFQKVFM